MRGITPCTYIHTLFTREVPLHDVAPMRDSKAMRRPATGRAVVSHGGMPLLTFCHAAPLQHDVFFFFWHRGWSSDGRDVSLACRRMIAGAFRHVCVKAMRGRRPWPGLAVPVRLPPFGLSPAASRTAPSNALHARAQTWQDQPRAAAAGGVTHSSQISSCLPSWGPSLTVRTKWEGGGWLPADGRGGGHGGVGRQACRYQRWPATQDATGKACRRDSCWRWPFEGGKVRSGNLATSKRRTGPTTRHHGTKRRGVLVHCSGADTSQRYGRAPCVRS